MAAVMNRMPPRARESMVTVAFFRFFPKFITPSPTGVRFRHSLRPAAAFMPSWGWYRRASMGETAAASLAGLWTESRVMT